MFPSCRSKARNCFHGTGTHGRPGLSTGYQHEPTGSPGEEQRPDRGQGPVTSLRNTDEVKICSLPKLAEVSPNPVVSSSLLVSFQCEWLDREHRGQLLAATDWKCFLEVLLRSIHTALLLDWFWGRAHRSNTAFFPCRGSWWPRITQAMPWRWLGCWWQHPPCAYPWEH